MKDYVREYKKNSPQFGELMEGTSQVYCEFEPRNATTRSALEFWLTELGISTTRPTSLEKYLRALSDVCMAVQVSIDGVVFWPSANAELTDCPYTMGIARKLRKALEGRYLKRVQKPSKKDKLCALYEVRLPDFGHPLEFKSHGLSPVIRVRSPKVLRAGKVTGGKNVSLKSIESELLQKLQKEIRLIRGCMTNHPLTHPNGMKFSRITRIFNNSSLTQGGRSYSNYQNYPESERLTMTIDGKPVCEIDIKSCYLAIIAGQCQVSLADDPYSVLPYIKEHSTEDEGYVLARKLMKLMVSKLLSVEGEPSAFPKGEKVKQEDGTSRTLTVKEKYNIPKHVTAKKLYSDIYETYPFLKNCNLNVFDLMYTESNIMIETMLQLIRDDIPSFPVHDCLICKISDQGQVLEVLRKNLFHHLGAVPALDVTYPDGDVKVHQAKYPNNYIKHSDHKRNNKYEERLKD